MLDELASRERRFARVERSQPSPAPSLAVDTMSFTADSFKGKLVKLSDSQQSIQTLSHWVQHHKRACDESAAVWASECLRAAPNRHLLFVYLANDIIQNSRKKGNEFVKSYGDQLITVLPAVYDLAVPPVQTKLVRMLSIWEERGVLAASTISELRSKLSIAGGDARAVADAAPPSSRQRAPVPPAKRPPPEEELISDDDDEYVPEPLESTPEPIGGLDDSGGGMGGGMAGGMALADLLVTLDQGSLVDELQAEREADLDTAALEAVEVADPSELSAAGARTAAAIELLASQKAKIMEELDARRKLIVLLANSVERQHEQVCARARSADCLHRHVYSTHARRVLPPPCALTMAACHECLTVVPAACVRRGSVRGSMMLCAGARRCCRRRDRRRSRWQAWPRAWRTSAPWRRRICEPQSARERAPWRARAETGRGARRSSGVPLSRGSPWIRSRRLIRRVLSRHGAICAERGRKYGRCVTHIFASLSSTLGLLSDATVPRRRTAAQSVQMSLTSTSYAGPSISSLSSQLKPVSFSAPETRRSSLTSSLAGSESSHMSLPDIHKSPAVSTAGVVRMPLRHSRSHNTFATPPRPTIKHIAYMDQLYANQHVSADKRGQHSMGHGRTTRTLSRMEAGSTAFGMPHWEPAVNRELERATARMMKDLLKPIPLSPLSRYRTTLTQWPSAPAQAKLTKWPTQPRGGATFRAG